MWSPPGACRGSVGSSLMAGNHTIILAGRKCYFRKQQPLIKILSVIIYILALILLILSQKLSDLNMICFFTCIAVPREIFITEIILGGLRVVGRQRVVWGGRGGG